MVRRFLFPMLALATLATFLLSVQMRTETRKRSPEPAAAIVLPASVQVVLYGGDRFLAADIETMRAAMSLGGMRGDEADFRLRAHQVVSQLNPCHEDNYWIGNGELTWGGSHEAGLDLLRRAMECRFWEEWPAFFYGFNQYFFRRDVAEAVRALELAAERSRDDKNPAFFRTFAVTLKAGQFDDARMALRLIEEERDQARDPRLRDSLDKRAHRLAGLILLREAQQGYEARFGHPLSDPRELLVHGFLAGFPNDPLGIGYAFENGRFKLHERKNPQLEALRSSH